MSNDVIKSVYQNSLYQKILHEIDGVIFPLSDQWKRIGISVSGGLDSALMSVLLCSIITQNLWLTKVHIISNIRCWKTRPWQRQNSLDVYNWLIKSFPNIEFQRHENFIAPDLEWGSKGPNIVDEYGKLKSGNQIELRAHAEYVAHKEKLDAFYINFYDTENECINKNFPPELVEYFKEKRDTPAFNSTTYFHLFDEKQHLNLELDLDKNNVK